MGVMEVTFNSTIDYIQFQEIRRIGGPDAQFAPGV